LGTPMPPVAPNSDRARVIADSASAHACTTDMQPLWTTTNTVQTEILGRGTAIEPDLFAAAPWSAKP
jgi:hypothetical protein